MNQQIIYIDTPVGRMAIHGTEEFVSAILFMDEPETVPATPDAAPVLYTCALQLHEYFEKERTAFDVPVAQTGTDFQQTVWHNLTTIPYAETITYLALAKRVGNPKSIRAVGTTNGRNQLNIIVPCHRVIGSNGALTGYGGGLWRKQWLLDHERGDLLF